MFYLSEELKSAGVYPTGPCSAWPEERNKQLMKQVGAKIAEENARIAEQNPDEDLSWLPRNPSIRQKYLDETRKNQKMPSIGKMAKGFVRTAGQAIAGGKVAREVRDERYATCEACPSFKPDSKRCAECGCFMQAKTWIAGDKAMLCPLDKWSR